MNDELRKFITELAKFSCLVSLCFIALLTLTTKLVQSGPFYRLDADETILFV